LEYSVRRSETAEEAVVGVWTRNLDGRRDWWARFAWFYRENPSGQGCAFVLESNGAGTTEVVGGAGLGTRTFFHRGKPLKAMINADFAVDAAHRTLLPALRLQRAIREHARGVAHFAYGFPNDSAVGVFRRLGYREVGRMTRYVLLLRHETYLERFVPRALAHWGGWALDGLRRGPELARRARTPSTRRLEWLPEADDRFDRLWQEASPQYALLGDRSAAFLRWRYARRPGNRSEIAGLLDTSGELRAYAVVTEPEAGLARIEDFLASPEAELGHLLDRLVPELRARRLLRVEVPFLGTRRVGRVLEAHGLAPREAKCVVFDPGESPSPDARLYGDSENWYLTLADEDT